MKLLAITTAVITCLVSQAQASELDPVVDSSAPQGLVVRISSDGKRELYKADLQKGIVESSAGAAEALQNTLKEENKVESVTPASELDRTTSDESWHWFWNALSSIGGYYSYNYSCGGRYYSYYPSYTYNYGGYQYNYYYSSSYYGYRGCYGYSDRHGYHYGRGHGWHH